MAFESRVTVRLYDTDAAGFLFYGAQFRLAHAALEDFLDHLGHPIAGIVRGGETLYPVVRAEADYRTPLSPGDRLVVIVDVRAIGDRSFTVGYRLLLEDGREAGSVVTVHAALDRATGSSRPLPAALRAALEPHLSGAT